MHVDRTRVLVLEAQELLREGLARVVSQDPGLALVEACESIAKALRVVERSRIDLLIMDGDFELRQQGFAFLKSVREKATAAKFIVMSDHFQPAEFVSLLQIGVTALVRRLQSAAELRLVISMCHDGGCWIDHENISVLSTMLQRHAGEGSVQFTPKERAVLTGVFNGLTSKEIAAQQHVTESSIKSILQHLFQKTNTKSRAHLIRLIMEQYPGVLEPAAGAAQHR